MNQELPYKIQKVGTDSPLLPKVIDLHAEGKSRLGPFPLGAFIDHASKKWILAAVAEDAVLTGYLLFRIAKNRATVVHLTTADAFRGKGVAETLINVLKEETTHLLGIGLSCRRDYDLAVMWSRFGFTVRSTRTGRGADQALLDYWWFDHNHDDLFSLATKREGSDKILVAIDANVFYDLTCEGRPQSEDTRVLEADWLSDSIVLCITPELYNEIHRAPDECAKQAHRTAAQGFRELRTNNEQVRKLEEELKPLFKGAILDRDESDMRQVAHAIAAQVAFFATRDGFLLDRAETILQKYGLRIMHPTELINRFDSLQREAEYRPVSLEGSGWRNRLMVADDVELVRRTFSKEERQSEFQRRVLHYLAHPEKWACRLVIDRNNVAVVFSVTSMTDAGVQEVELLRYADHPLAPTLLRHVLHDLICHASRNPFALRVKEHQLDGVAVSALRETGFIPDGGEWWRSSFRGLITAEQLLEKLQDTLIPKALKEKVFTYIRSASRSPGATLEIERILGPGKIKDGFVPAYVVSIRPEWAAHFFDIPVGGQLLMDLKEKLHLGIEGAYYCSSNNTHVSAPARILWYVSKGRSGIGSMEVKACSTLEEVVIDKPKEVFSRFKRLGVYEWNHVFETARSSVERDVMALRFSRTERFKIPVTLQELQKLGVPDPQNPRRITPEQFDAIYARGMELKQQE